MPDQEKIDNSKAQINPEIDYRSVHGNFGVNLPIFTFDAYKLLERVKEAAETGNEFNVLFIASGYCALAIAIGKFAIKYSNIKVNFNDLAKENLDELGKILQESRENITYHPGDIFNVNVKENHFNAVVMP